MTAAADFARRVGKRAARVQISLNGSLALTGKGHATDRAVLLGLAGHEPATIDPDAADREVEAIRATGRLRLNGEREIGFTEDRDLQFLQRERLDFHSNAMRCTAFGPRWRGAAHPDLLSIGGGAVLDEDQIGRNAPAEGVCDSPYPFRAGNELLARARETGLSVADMMRANEEATLTPDEVSARLRTVRDAMSACIDRGIRSELAELPAVSMSAAAYPPFTRRRSRGRNGRWLIP